MLEMRRTSLDVELRLLEERRMFGGREEESMNLRPKSNAICEDQGVNVRGFIMKVMRFSLKQSIWENYKGYLKGGSENSRGKRLAISMVVEAWMGEKEKM
ncbi:hypothetical protein Tco_0592819 [Tanacetum coccineum]